VIFKTDYFYLVPLIKAFSIIILAVLGLSIFGVYPMLKVMQYHAEACMEDSLKQNLPASKLTVFENASDNKQVEWERADKEFRYNGSMYDVVRVEKKNGRLIYYCLSDVNEAQVCTLIQKLVSIQLGSDTPLHSNAQKILKLFVQVFMPCERYQCDMVCLNESIDLLYPTQDSHYCCFVANNIAPPPRLTA